MVKDASFAAGKNLTLFEDLELGVSFEYPSGWSRHKLEDSKSCHLLIQPANLETALPCGKMNVITRNCPEGSTLAQLASNYVQACKKLRCLTLVRSKPGAFAKHIAYPSHLLCFVFKDENERLCFSVVGLFLKGTRLIIVSGRTSWNMRHFILPEIRQGFNSITLL
jgi:hypothetical protein